MGKQMTCHTCIYAHWDRGLWMRSLGSGWPARPTCGNQPDSPGRMKECPHGRVCRNYRPRPPVPTGDAVKMIPLGEGLYAYVDAEDFEWLNQWHWRAHDGYAARQEKRNGKRTVVFMHRQIMKSSPGKVTDHINGNKFDNTRANLRNVTRQQNTHNKSKHAGGTSIYKGVSYDKRCHKWLARIYFAKEYYYLGSFATEVEAARAYDYKAVELFGEFARLNFPEEWPAERRAEVHAQWQKENRKTRARKKVKSKTGPTVAAGEKPGTGKRRKAKARR